MDSSFQAVRDNLRRRLAGPPSAPVLLVGPRHVGKTTMLLDLAGGRGDQAMYVSGDNPTALLPASWTRLWEDVEARAHRRDLTVMLDEIHQWPEWSTRLNAALRQAAKLPVTVIATASVDERPHANGERRSAVVFDRLRLSHWSASSVAETFEVDPADAADAVVSFGGYPGAYQFMADPPRWSAFVRESIVEPALGRDVGALAPIRQPALLRQIFAMAALHPCETISLQRMQAVLLQTGALATIGSYLKWLEDAGLVAPLSRYSPGRARQRAAPPKLVVLNNALLSALHPGGAPDRAREPARHGVWIENACLAFAINAGQHVSYWREEPFDVDAVIDGDWGKWAIEVMPDAHSAVDYRGLHEFVARYPEFQPLVVTSAEHTNAAARAGLMATTWQNFLLTGPPR